MPTFDGSRGTVHYRQWAVAEPELVVVLLHGLGEHIGLYEPLAEHLTGEGIELWAHDHAGHGLSDGERVLVEKVDDLIADAKQLLDIVTAARPGVPVVLLGHSLGATVSTLLVGEGGFTPVKLVLAGSSLIPNPNGLAALLASGLDPMSLRKDPSELSTNVEYTDQIRQDPLVWQGGLRPETLLALADASARTGKVIESGSLTLPTLLLHGSADDLASAEFAQVAAETLPDARAVIYPAKLHNVLNESNRDEVHADLLRFLRVG